MSKRKLLRAVLSVALSVCLAFGVIPVSAGVLTFETQYDYDEADIAWLTDLVIKEDMTTVEGMAQRVDLVPDAEYPYTETAESFSDEVDYFTALYNLELGSERAGYIYFFELLNANNELLAADVSDADIKDYLEGVGISYPSSPSSDDYVMARVLFTALVSGAYGNGFSGNGLSLEEAAVSYLAKLTGVNINTLKEWMPDGSVQSLDDYILAASKLTLWSNGYNVSSDTDDDEVYRLIAVMTVKSQGISADSSLSYDELKLKYMATLLGKKYSVSLDSAKLGEALQNDTVAFYILQLMGKKSGLSLREDNSTYEEAFKLVAENTGVFDVSSDDFYADIKFYDVYLKGLRSSIWVYPTAFVTNLSSYDVLISVNGITVRNNYYNEIDLDTSKDEQMLYIKVTANGNGRSSECIYAVTVHQGDYSSVPGDKPVEEGYRPSYSSADSLVADVLANLGMNSVISAVLNKTYDSLPKTVSGVVSFIAPTFEGDTPVGSVSDGGNENDEFFIAVLDEIGSVMDTEISGIPGIELTSEMSDADSFITFG